MFNVIACCKWTLDESELSVNPDRSVDYSRAQYKLSLYDRQCAEMAAQLAPELGGAALGLTFSPEVPKALVKDALSRKLDELYYINDERAAQADAIVTATALAAQLKRMQGVGLVICAEGAGDTYARQIPCRIAAALDLPLVTSVCAASVQGQVLTATRRLENELQTVEVSLPAVIAVLPEICEPPIPGMKAIITAGKKPVHTISAQELGVDMTPGSLELKKTGFVVKRKGVLLEGNPEEIAASLKDALIKEGVL